MFEKIQKKSRNFLLSLSSLSRILVRFSLIRIKNIWIHNTELDSSLVNKSLFCTKTIIFHKSEDALSLTMTNIQTTDTDGHTDLHECTDEMHNTILPYMIKIVPIVYLTNTS